MKTATFLCTDIKVVSKDTQIKQMIPTKGYLTMLNEDEFLFIVEPNEDDTLQCFCP